MKYNGKITAIHSGSLHEDGRERVVVTIPIGSTYTTVTVVNEMGWSLDDEVCVEFGMDLKCQNCEELERLFELQHSRVMEASKAWQKETGQDMVLPDLGDLVEWLMKKAGLK